MRRLLILVLLTSPVGAVAQPSKLPKLTDERCVPYADRVRVPAPKPKAGPRQLGKMPPARAYYTVYREAGGCPVPAAVGDEAKKR